MMIREMEDRVKEIIGALEKKEWVSSYEIFYQNTKRLTAIDSGDIPRNRDIVQSGYALRVISKSQRLIELSINQSSIKYIKELKEPSSTQNKVQISQFPELKEPRINSIVGDGNPDSGKLEKRIQQMQQLNSEIEIPDISRIQRMLDITIENRVVVNTGSHFLKDKSMKLNYQVEYLKYQDGYIYRSITNNYLRNFNIDFDRTESMARQSLLNKLLYSPNIDYNSIKGVILKPDIVSKIISSLAITLLQNSRNMKIANLGESLQLIDDPHRASGYNSIMFDDEGSLTRPNYLIENSEFKNSLHDRVSSNWKGGGNGFRTAMHSPMPRSYKYSINRFFSNLSVFGGVGKGHLYSQRNGLVMLIEEGEVSLFHTSDSIQVIIHGHVTQIWKDGNFLGPGKSLTLFVDLGSIFSVGSYSADQVLVVDKAIPGSVYCGWVYLQKENLRINWN